MKDEACATVNVSEKNVPRFTTRIRELTGRSRGISRERRLLDRLRFLQGWSGYFALAAQLIRFDHFDPWIRRRLRNR